MNDYLALAGGVVRAGIGGELFLRGLVGLARWLRVSLGIIGATVSAFATSALGLSVGISSAAAGRPKIWVAGKRGDAVTRVECDRPRSQRQHRSRGVWILLRLRGCGAAAGGDRPRAEVVTGGEDCAEL